MYGGQKADKIFKIYDCLNKTQLTSLKVKNPEIVGRFKSDLYTLVDGHFYFQNEVLKVRYDLLAEKKLTNLTEE
jgi:hypothetical protein